VADHRIYEQISEWNGDIFIFIYTCIHLHVCEYGVYMYVNMYECLCVWRITTPVSKPRSGLTQVFVCMYICAYIYMCIYAYYVCLCVCGGSPHLRANLGVDWGHVYIHIYTRMYLPVFIYVYICVCVFVYCLRVVRGRLLHL